jgi:hypothetical protein
MLVKTTSPKLLQRLSWIHEASYNEKSVDSRAVDLKKNHPATVNVFPELV